MLNAICVRYAHLRVPDIARDFWFASWFDNCRLLNNTCMNYSKYIIRTLLVEILGLSTWYLPRRSRGPNIRYKNPIFDWASAAPRQISATQTQYYNQKRSDTVYAGPMCIGRLTKKLRFSVSRIKLQKYIKIGLYRVVTERPKTDGRLRCLWAEMEGNGGEEAYQRTIKTLFFVTFMFKVGLQ